VIFKLLINKLLMTKNEEKAHAMLNRWVAMKKELNSHSKDKRPTAATECSNLQECERWRNQVIKEITKKVADIQNASLGEYKIRELNDETNKLFREKGHWEDRIKELGGPDYRKLAPKTFDSQGFELPGSGGYKYWGAAKDLPGVRDLFVKEAPNAPRKSRADLYKNIDYEYYGFKDQFNEELEKFEKDAEDILMEEYFKDVEEQNFEIGNKKQKLDDDLFHEPKLNFKVKQELFDEEEFTKFKNMFVSEIKNNLLENKKDDYEMEMQIVEKKKKHLIKMFDLEEFENMAKDANEILKDNKINAKPIQ
jgi:pre-mRNA-splicing factor ISY1